MGLDVKILVCTHKPYQMPADTTLYIPVQAGCSEVQERFGYMQDNTGDNISYKHRYYSEWSVIYWAWKNLVADYVGICHYRRYFVSNTAKKEQGKLFRYILSRNEVEALLQNTSVILAKRRHYYIEKLEGQYGHAHNPKDFNTTREIIAELFPDYLPAFNTMANRTWGHMFDTFIMRKQLMDDMCSFIFPVVFELEKRSDFSQYDEYQSRVCGFVAERLIDVWLIKTGCPYKEVELAMLERPNWPKKVRNFVLHKFWPKTRAFQVKEGN